MKFSSLAKFAICTVSGLVAPIESTRVLAADVSSPSSSTNTDESFRLSFELKTPRRFASRFRKATRTLEVRVTPAQAKEFDSSTFYDTRFVHRLVIREDAGEVILGFQLRNENLGWLVTYQENPWRLVLDLWRTDSVPHLTLEEQWQWQNDFAGEQRSQNGAGALSGKPIANSGTNSNTTKMLSSVSSSGNPRSSSDSGLLEGTSRGTSGGNVAPLQQPTRKGSIPAAYGRIEELMTFPNDRIEDLQRQSGEAVGTTSEFARVNDLAAALYLSGRSEPAIGVYRRLVSMSETKFRENPENLWRAGESAFLTRRFDLAKDYFRTLQSLYPDTGAGSQARLRLADIDILSAEGQLEKSKSDSIAVTYADIALSKTSSGPAKIASSLRILKEKIDSNPESAGIYQQNLALCVGKDLVPFEMRKDCSYIKTRSIIEKIEINSADREVQEFKKFTSQDPRWQQLDARIAARVRDLLMECQQKKTWDTWIDFEQNARAKLLDFTRSDANLLMARASAWEAAGNMKNAAKLYSLTWDSTSNRILKDNAAAHAALVSVKSKNLSVGEKYLRSLEKSPARKQDGFSADTAETLRTLAQPPYRNKTALKLLVHEISNARFVERDLSALLNYAKILRGSKESDTVYEKILAHPSKTPDETKSIETILFQYSEDLSRTGKNQKSAEILAAVANIQSGTRRAEAAYKAGIAFARAGQLEKAKTSWQIAASDISDKRFSTLANERLDRIR